ncbi:MAG: hypothetical protein R3212_08855 [Xanthomonadales bacterium]|nr:hypothetical protein [Xanthomonadales bacterium]
MSHIRLPYLAALTASGADAGSFLQAQLTADLTRLADQGISWSGYCDPKGNVIALLRVARKGDAYQLIAAASLMDTVISTLERYRLRARVQFLPDDEAVVGLVEGERPRYEVLSTDETAVDPDPQQLAAWRAAELRAGIAWLGPKTSGMFLPQMLGHEDIEAISFRKGCFPGQEVIARVRYLGKLKRLPLVVVVGGEHELEPASEVRLGLDDGSAGSGVVVDSATETGRTVIYLVVRDAGSAPARWIETEGERLEIAS